MSIVSELNFVTSSAAETEALGGRLAGAIVSPTLLLMSGELGAGKTSFVRGMLRGLDAPADVRVTSPTYVLQHVYAGGRCTLYHIDAYRIAGGGDEFAGGGLMECLDDPLGIVCIEWPEKISDVNWPGDRITIEFEHLEPTVRAIRVAATGERSRAILSQLQQ
jgi:tRNA threonylcarbamoyladenosine biosynthesis protein TsaE